MKTPNQSKKPDDFGSKGGEDKGGKKQLKQGSKNISFFSALVNSSTIMN
jgi:hypothetical protein